MPIISLLPTINVFKILYGFVLTSLISKTPFLARDVYSKSLYFTLFIVPLSVTTKTKSLFSFVTNPLTT